MAIIKRYCFVPFLSDTPLKKWLILVTILSPPCCSRCCYATLPLWVQLALAKLRNGEVQVFHPVELVLVLWYFSLCSIQVPPCAWPHHIVVFQLLQHRFVETCATQSAKWPWDSFNYNFPCVIVGSVLFLFCKSRESNFWFKGGQNNFKKGGAER